MDKPLNRRRNHSNDKADGNNPVRALECVQVLRQRPSDSIAVQTLNHLATPYVRPERILQYLVL